MAKEKRRESDIVRDGRDARGEREEISRLEQQVQAAGVELIHLQFIDIPGAIKTVTIPAGQLRASLEQGVWFDGSAIEGIARIAESDLYLWPDSTTFSLVPWEATPAARVICDLRQPDGQAFRADPRATLKAALVEAANRGLQYRVASEVEFFVLDDSWLDDARSSGTRSQQNRPVGNGGYFGGQPPRAADLCRLATRALDGLGFEVEAMHHETAPGQHEIDFAEMEALRAADAIITLKWALRAFGQRAQLLVSFMPKPFEGLAGSGLHLHQRLTDMAGLDLFFNPADEHQLSASARHFIGGQLAHARGMCAIIAPLINSYKRLSGANEAPGHVYWARVNREALIRVAETTPARGSRIELRAPDPGCNPYLALAVALRTGLDGLDNQMPAPAPIELLSRSDRDATSVETADPLPVTLLEALEEMEWDPLIRAALGQSIFEFLLAAKEHEWAAYGRHISDWEIENYLEGA